LGNLQPVSKISIDHHFSDFDFPVRKNDADTRSLGSKVPPGNDKVPEDTTPEIEAWFQEPIKE
jgi:hypothetical protein